MTGHAKIAQICEAKANWADEFNLISASTEDCAEDHQEIHDHILALITQLSLHINNAQSLEKYVNEVFPSDDFDPDKVSLKKGELTLDKVHNALTILAKAHLRMVSEIHSHEHDVLDEFTTAQRLADSYDVGGSAENPEKLAELIHTEQTNNHQLRK